MVQRIVQARALVALSSAILVGCACAASQEASRRSQAVNGGPAAAAPDANVSAATLLRPALRLGLSAASTAATVALLSVGAAWLSASYRRASAQAAASAEASRALSQASMYEISEEHLPSFSASHGYGHRERSARGPLLRSQQSVPNIRAGV
jgi:hypothetical protein